MAAYEDYLNEIFEILRPIAAQNHTIQENTEFVADLGLSSLQIMEMVEQIEDHFDLAVPINILPEIRTIKDFAQQLVTLSKRSA